MKGLMITAPHSNSGKTTVALALNRALANRGYEMSAFKTGPDFIDPKYHEKANRRNCGNLDLFMQSEEGLKEAVGLNPGEFVVVEGAMGYFDGLRNTVQGSSYDIGRKLNLPAIAVYTPMGEMFSVVPTLQGMYDYSQGRMMGVIFNKVSKSTYELLRDAVEENSDVRCFGYLEPDEKLVIPSRYLGLLQPEEMENVEAIIERAAQRLEETVDIDRLIECMQTVLEKELSFPKKTVRIAIAKDEAFSFHYRENEEILKKIGTVEYFSVLHDKEVPPADLLILGGGYPELFKDAIQNNRPMLESIRTHIESGKRTLAIGGGLMLLSKAIDETPMIGIFPFHTKMHDKRVRFGYCHIELEKDGMLGEKGDRISAKEFHNSAVVEHIPKEWAVTKENRPSWRCGYRYKNTWAMYQHFSFLGNKKVLDYLWKETKMYEKKPMAIENKSMQIIDEVMGDVSFTREEMPIVKRMIHTTGDFEYRHIVKFSEDFITQAKKIFAEQPVIYTDTRMVAAGINKKALQQVGGSLVTLVDEEEVRARATKEGRTRSSVAIDVAMDRGVRIFAIGNAPTALFRILERTEEGGDVALVIGVPVGFVGAAESKEALRQFTPTIPHVTTEGNKGGSNVAASIINALLYQLVER